MFQKQSQLTFTLIVWTKHAIKVNVDWSCHSARYLSFFMLSGENLSYKFEMSCEGE